MVYCPYKSRWSSSIAYKICVTSARKLLFGAITAEYQKASVSLLREIKDKKQFPFRFGL